MQAADEQNIYTHLSQPVLTKRWFANLPNIGSPRLEQTFFCCWEAVFPKVRVTLNRIQQVQKIESLMRVLGFQQFRARFHLVEEKQLLRIEIGQDDFSLFSAAEIQSAIREAAISEGFHWVTLDLTPYGSS